MLLIPKVSFLSEQLVNYVLFGQEHFTGHECQCLFFLNMKKSILMRYTIDIYRQ